mmetsp:Transcript_22825/g.31318  ORF Transcript_22825/g.31318 Transcript_22825/m.31318 type:complete len:141 (-) Transcript_22825:78-500(-)
MIHCLLIQNKAGKTRLEKWFTRNIDGRILKANLYKLLRNRELTCNFHEYGNFNIVFRRYAGLFFILCTDSESNSLANLELLHLLVEVLDHYFGNVCELDIIFNYHRVHMVVDEIILAGEIQETSKGEILSRVSKMEKLNE